MNESKPSQALFDEFAPPSLAEWEKEALDALKGRPLESLDWTLDAGIVMKPFYRNYAPPAGSEAPGDFPFRRGDGLLAAGEGWQVVQEIAVDGDAPLDRMKEALDAGVYAFKLYSHSGSVVTPALYKPLFSTLRTDSQALHLFAGAADKLQLLDALQAALDAGPGNTSQLTGCFFHAASLNPGLDGQWDREAEALKKTGEAWPHFRCLGFDLGVFAESGATPVQQMAYGLAAVAEYIAVMANKGIAPETVLKNVAFAFSIESSFFPEMAKLRAFRSLYARLLAAYDIDNPASYMPFILAQGTGWNLTRYDRHNNLLRATTEGISAVLGGCHALALPAFDRAESPESALPARMARNIQFLLRYEAYLGIVADPGGGSYYLEALTDQQAAAAWKLFQEIESKGGFAACYDELIRAVAETQRNKEKALARQKQVLVGINKYPNTSEVLPPPEKHMAAGDLFQPIGGERMRAADRFERLREQVDGIGTARGGRLKAFFLLFGDTRMRSARAIFSRNLIGAAGFEIVENTHPEDLTPSVEEAKAARPELMVLCSADPDYFAQAPALITELRNALPGTTILIAGKPAGAEALPADDFLFAGMDAIAFLETLLPKVLH